MTILRGYVMNHLKLYLIATTFAILPNIGLAKDHNNNWITYGGDLQNSHHASEKSNIKPNKMDDFQLKWTYQTTVDEFDFTTGLPFISGDVEVTPAIYDGIAYFPDDIGQLHAVDTNTGMPIWVRRFFDGANPNNDYSGPSDLAVGYDPAPDEVIGHARSTPAVNEDYVITGSRKHLFFNTCPEDQEFGCIPHPGAVLIAVDRHTGDMKWKTMLEPHPGSGITAAPIIVGNAIYVGTSSWEEELAASSSLRQYTNDPNDAGTTYPCCSFRGSVIKVDLHTGEILARFYTTPGSHDILNPPPGVFPGNLPDSILTEQEKANGIGYSGAAVWGSSFSIDKKRKQIYVSTGNNYRVPHVANQCHLYKIGDIENPPELPIINGVQATCDNLNDLIGNHFDSILALDMDTLELNWNFRAREFDPWVHGCSTPDFYLALFPPIVGLLKQFNLENCPGFENPRLVGPDFGFGQSPMLMKQVKINDKEIDLVGAGEKSGIFYALNADTGELVWQTRVSPGGIVGGMQWGSAYDGKRIYTASSNSANACRDKNQPFYESPIAPLYPGHPIIEQIVNPQNAINYISGPGFPNDPDKIVYPNSPFNGGAWTLINPPDDAFEQAIIEDSQVSSYIEDGKLKTIHGFWSALDPATGTILWQRQAPSYGERPISNTLTDLFSTRPMSDPCAGFIEGGVAVTQNVLFGGTSNSQGDMVALDARDGSLLFAFPSGGGVEAGPAIVDGVVYWGSGASMGGAFSSTFLAPFTPPDYIALTGYPFSLGGLHVNNNRVFAFEIPDDDSSDNDTSDDEE